MTTEPTTISQERRFRDFFAVLKRRWVLVTLTILVCVGLSLAVTLILEPTYGSTTIVELEGRTHDFATENPFDPLGALSVPNPTDDLPTQVEVLMSGAVFEGAVQKANIGNVIRLEDGTPMDPVIKAKQVGQTNIIALTAESKDGGRAQRLATAIPNAYRDYVQTKMSAQLDGAILFMQNQYKAKQAELVAAQAALDKFRTANHITNGDQENQQRLAHVASAEADLRTAEQRYSSAVSYYNSMQAALKALPARIPNPNRQASDQLVQQVKQKIADLEGQLEAKRAIYTDNSQEVRSLQAQLDAQNKALKSMPSSIEIGGTIRNPLTDTYEGKAAEAKGQLDGALSARATAQAAVAAANKELGDFNLLKGKLDQLSLSVLTATNILEHTHTQLQDLEVRQSKAKSPITTVSPPSPPVIVRPIMLLNLAIGFIIGVGIAAGLVRLRESSDDRIWSSEIGIEASGLPALGSIALGASRLPALITQDRSLAQSDNYRMLRSSLLNNATGEAFRSIAVTSALAEEGRSETAVNLAASMAMGGHQVVLIDANFRKPAIATMMSVPENPGLAELLRKQAAAKDVVRSTNVEGLYVIPAGNVDSTVADLLGSEAFSALMEDLKERYHFVVVDTSPCLAGADGPVTAAACEAAIFVIKLGISRRSATRYCTELLRRTHAQVLGVVTNRPGANPKTEYRDYADA